MEKYTTRVIQRDATAHASLAALGVKLQEIDFLAPVRTLVRISQKVIDRYGVTIEDWSQLADQRTVNFANLAPGRYRFLVRAVNADGVASSEPAAFTFTILPPIWRRWWVTALAALVVGLITYALYRYRLRQLLELERVRPRIAADLHGDIGSSLSQIAVLSEVLRRKSGGDDSGLAKPLAQIAHVSRETIEKGLGRLRDFVGGLTA
jgi:signal transduction histidine kinase